MLLLSAALLLTAFPAHAQLSLFAAVDLARRNSPAVRIAQADVDHAKAGLSESKDAYLPSLAAGSSIGYSYGFPVGEPTIYNFQAHSLALSFSQPDYIRSARAALRSATLSLQDSLSQVELDTTVDYLQLDTVTQELAALEDEKKYAEQLDAIEQDRLDAGVESQIAATKAELNAAQADLRRLDLQAQAAVLRQQLSHLTGLPIDDMAPEPETVPGPPDFAAVEANKPALPQSVEASVSNATSKHFLAHGDSRINYRPQIAFGVNYSRYAKFNNYELYYLRFQHNNFDVGLQVQLPIFDATKDAQAAQSAASAVHADQEAKQARNQASEQLLQLQGHVPELRAQSKVAELQWKLAGEQLQALNLQLKAAPTNPNAAPPTPIDEMSLRINERNRYAEALDARFSLLKAQLTLLRNTGGLHDWINTAVR